MIVDVEHRESKNGKKYAVVIQVEDYTDSTNFIFLVRIIQIIILS